LAIYDISGDLIESVDVPTQPALPGSRALVSSAGEGDERERIGDHMAGTNGLAIDSRGDVYIAEVTFSAYNAKFDAGIGTDHRVLHKFVLHEDKS
jgi:hypothetical protein